MKFTEHSFQLLVSYWAGKLNLPLPLFHRENRMKWSATITYCEDCEVFNFNYNFEIIKTYTHSAVAGLIFHELGHIKYKTYKSKDKVKNEYVAEKFSLECLKKYYLDFYKEEIKEGKETLKDKDWRKRDPIHAKAFDKIKEYK